MKYMMMIKHSEHYRHEDVPQSLFEAMDQFVSESAKRGVFKDGAGLKPSAEGFRVRLSDRKLGVLDGPFTESKEIVGGYALVDVESKEQAVEVARQFMEIHRVHWPEFVGECEARPLEDEAQSP